MATQIRLKIADIIIELRSAFRMQPLTTEYELRNIAFVYRGRRKPDIILRVRIQKRPLFYKGRRIFATFHPISGDTRWVLFKKNNEYIISHHILHRKQYIAVNRDFNKGRVYLPSNNDRQAWRLEDILNNPLQIILINYLSQNDGILVHGAGLKDASGEGFLFLGPSQSGKSTTAKIWHNYSKAKVLNDDRIIIRKRRNKFYIFGSPWHGNFNDYLVSEQGKAELRRVFFIYHARFHKVNALEQKMTYCLLYSNIFPTFWDKTMLEKQSRLCQNITNTVSSCRLGFKKDKSVINFVRAC